MFEKLTEQLNSLVELGEVKEHKAVVNARKLLQAIKIEAQRLRVNIISEFKNSKIKK
jgi:coenzyme F420-reducing hydrogenase delta subunit